MTTQLPKPDLVLTLQHLTGEYWDIAYLEGKTQESRGSDAQATSNEIPEALKAYGAAEYKRGILAAMNCYSPDDSATDWMDKIRKLGEKS